MKKNKTMNSQALQRCPCLSASIAMVLSAGLLGFSGLSQAQIFNDSLLFETSNQSLWSSGGALGWSYDSGFIGGDWGGGRSASSPVSLGINGIAGDAQALITPEVPGYTTPSIPSQLITAEIPSKLLTPYIAPKQILPGVPAVYSPEVKEVRSKKRTAPPTYWPPPSSIRASRCRASTR